MEDLIEYTVKQERCIFMSRPIRLRVVNLSQSSADEVNSGLVDQLL
jgi:hypothetical protein